MPSNSTPARGGGDPAARQRGAVRRDLGRLSHYSVTKLFGSRDISFALDEDDPTVLTGVNGTGKSTVLRTIDAISTGRWPLLLETRFERLTLRFSKGRVLTVEQKPEIFVVRLSGEEPWVAGRRSTTGRHEALFNRLNEYDLRSDIRRSTERLRDLEYQLAALTAEANTYAAEHLLALRDELAHGIQVLEEPPSWVRELSIRFPVLFVTDQRLVIDNRGKEARRRSETTTRVAADEAARNIADEIEAAQAMYARESQTLDRTSPRRVIGAMSQPVQQVGEKKLREDLDQLSILRKSLQRSGLLPQDATEEFEELDLTTPHVRAYVATYVGDMRSKLLILEPLRRRLALFTEFLSQHYGSKTVVADQQNGFLIRVEGSSDTLPPSRLSSGEQQILVLAHHILFRASPGTLVLIDEPELSLHVLWQATMIEDLAEMGRERQLSFLLATHSPTLLAGREDLKRSLDG